MSGSRPISEQVAEEDPEPQRRPRRRGTRSPSRSKALPRPLATSAGRRMKIAGEERRAATPMRPAHRLARDLLLLGDLAVGRPRQRLEPERHRLGERHDPAHQRDLRPALGPRGGVVGLDLDVAFGRAHGDRPRALAAHHHAFHDGLAAHVAGRGGARCGGHGRSSERRVRPRPASSPWRLRGALGGVGLGVAALEALDPATGVDQLLLARVEGVALRAELDAEARDRGAGRELVAAGAVHACTRRSRGGCRSSWRSSLRSRGRNDQQRSLGIPDASEKRSARTRTRRGPRSRGLGAATSAGVSRIAGQSAGLGDLGEELVVALGGADLVDEQLEALRRPRAR